MKGGLPSEISPYILRCKPDSSGAGSYSFPSVFRYLKKTLPISAQGQKPVSPKLLLCKGYRPEARGYLIYSPRALPEGAARGQHTRGMNHITTSWRPINGLFLHWRGFLKGCKKYTDEKYLYCSYFSCFPTLHAGTSGIHKFLGLLIMSIF